MLLADVFALPSPDPPLADHHMHIRSDDATDAFITLLKELEGRTVDDLEGATGASDILTRLDAAGVRYGVLLSVAYFFGAPDVEFENEQARVRSENRYVGDQAAVAPDRLVAFCSVNPLAEYAMEEVRWCGENESITGLKLHLANSDVDLRKAEHVDVLREIAELANDLGLPVVAHIYTRHPEYGYEDAEVFISEILPVLTDVPVQVAHLGGPGPFRDAAASASQAFVDAFEEKPEVLSNVYFDLAEVLIPAERAGDDEEVRQAIESMNAAAVEQIRALGPERILYGSDWIFDRETSEYVDVVSNVPLPEDLLNKIASNRAPYLP